jgi:type II secretion system protein H
MIRFTIQASRVFSPRTAQRRARGFTLIELLIVIAIAAILAAVAAPAFKSMIRNVAVRGAASELVAGIQFARSEAIRANRAITLTLDKDTRRWRVFFDKDSDDAYDSVHGDELLRDNTYTETILPMTQQWSLKFQPSGLIEGAAFPAGICLQTGENPLAQRLIQFTTRMTSPVILEECPK